MYKHKCINQSPSVSSMISLDLNEDARDTQDGSSPPPPHFSQLLSRNNNWTSLRNHCQCQINLNYLSRNHNQSHNCNHNLFRSMNTTQLLLPQLMTFVHFHHNHNDKTSRRLRHTSAVTSRFDRIVSVTCCIN